MRISDWSSDVCSSDLQLTFDLASNLIRDPCAGREWAAERRDAGTRARFKPRTLGALVRSVRVSIHLGRCDVEPGVIEGVMLRSGAEVPHNGVAVPRDQGKPDELVHRPRADVRTGGVPNIREVEREQRPQIRDPQLMPEPRHPGISKLRE